MSKALRCKKCGKLVYVKEIFEVEDYQSQVTMNCCSQCTKEIQKKRKLNNQCPQCGAKGWNSNKCLDETQKCLYCGYLEDL